MEHINGLTFSEPVVEFEGAALRKMTWNASANEYSEDVDITFVWKESNLEKEALYVFINQNKVWDYKSRGEDQGEIEDEVLLWLDDNSEFYMSHVDIITEHTQDLIDLKMGGK